MPPALSVTGPNESIATMMPAIESCAMTAIAMPYVPASAYETRIPKMITIAGSAVACIEIPRPAIMFVACPVVEALAMPFTGPNCVPV